MAKAARKKDPVYDPDSDRPITRPDLRVMEGGGQGDGVPQGNLSAAEPGGLYNADGDQGKSEGSEQEGNQTSGDGSTSENPEQTNDAVPPDELQSEESSGDSGYASGFDNNRPTRRARTGAFAKRNKNKLIWGAAAGGGILGLTIGALISLVPLKIENMVNNLEQRFMSPVSSAVETTNRILLSNWLEKNVIPAYKNCGTVIDANCKISISGPGNPVKNLYKSWAKQRLDLYLKKNGIEISYDQHAINSSGKRGTFILRIEGKNKNFDIGPDGKELSTLLTGSRSDVTDEMDRVLLRESNWRHMAIRYKVGRLMTQLHSSKRCLAFCGIRKVQEYPRKYLEDQAKLFLVERVLAPRSESVSVALQCILSPSCDPNQVDRHECTAGVDCELDGRFESETERQNRTELQRLTANFGRSQQDEIFRIYNQMSEEGLQKYMVRTVMTKVFNETAGKAAAKAIPVVGWIQLYAEVVDGAYKAGPKIKKLSYVVGATAAVQHWSNYRTYADEIHTGEVDPVAVGSWNTSLGRGVPSKTDPLVGGTAAAEETPLYDALMNNSETPQPSAVASLFSAFLPGKAYAATATATDSTSNPDYTCNGGKTVPSGQLVCPEEMLGAGNGAANAVHEFLDSNGPNAFVAVANVWNSTIGAAFDLFYSVSGAVGDAASSGLEFALEKSCGKTTILGVTVYAIDATPFALVGHGVCTVKSLAEEYLPKALDAATNYLIPNPFGTNMSGGRNFDMMAAGANVQGLDACDQIGCESTSDAAVAQVTQDAMNKERDMFEQQPLKQRLFATDSSHSLINQVAMATPFDMQASLQTSFAGLLSNPFGALTDGFGSAFSSGKAYAASTQTANPFGAGAKIFPTNKIPKDPEQYWIDHNCDDTSDNGPIAKWQEAASKTTDENTGMPKHEYVEPCLLIKYAVGVVGGKDDTSLLTQDDLAEVGGSTSTEPESDGDATIAGNAQQLAQQIQQQAKDGKIVFNVLNNADKSDGSTPEANIDDMAAGKPAKTTSNCGSRGAQAPVKSVALDDNLLKFILDLSKSQTIEINALAGQCHSSSNSQHYKGKAVDFDCPFNAAAGNSIGRKYNVADTTNETCDNKAQHYHYSVGGG